MADASDSKSDDLRIVRVQVPPLAIFSHFIITLQIKAFTLKKFKSFYQQQFIIVKSLKLIHNLLKKTCISAILNILNIKTYKIKSLRNLYSCYMEI